MVSEKALYWAAAVVMVVGVSTSYVNKYNADWVACVGNRGLLIAESIVDRFGSHADSMGSRADSMIARVEARIESRLGRGESAVARAQTRLASVQTSIAQRQAEMDRRHAGKMLFLAEKQIQMQMKDDVVICSDKDSADDNANVGDQEDDEN